MKVVCTDNYNREEVADTLVCENVNKYYGELIVDFLNEKLSGDEKPDYYTLEEDDYVLYTPDL